MNNKVSVAVLGSSGYVGLELIYLLSSHPNVNLNFLGSNSHQDYNIKNIDNRFKNISLPNLKSYSEFISNNIDVVFLCLPHRESQKFVKENFTKCKIIDLSADFRLDDPGIYKENYHCDHLASNLLNEFLYGLFEVNYKKIKNYNNISVPGCYPTSILLPLIPLLKNKLISNNNIIIDSKSGYSGAGKNFDLKNLFHNDYINFYNYKTNNHRHICEINQELFKINNSKVFFSFNPHILPIFRGLMSTIYCDLNSGITNEQIIECLNNYYSNFKFVNIINDSHVDFFMVQNTNKCLIKIEKHYDSSKIILVSLIDNLIKGASGQAIQCMNLMFNLNENLGLKI